MIEQRQKNVSVANTSSKRDREEIDSLRKQISNLKDEMNQKDKYNKAQTDRLSRQINDVRQENNELRDEIAHYDQELRELREQQFVQMEDNASASNVNQNSMINNKVHYSGIG